MVQEESPQAPSPEPATSSRWSRFWSFVGRHGYVATGTLIVTVATPFLLVSEATLKKYLDTWLNDCLLVFEVSAVKGNRLLVTGYARGKLPATLPITFSARNAEINSILFINEVERPGSDVFTNLAVHPQTNLICPGPLCEELGSLPSTVNPTIVLADIHPEFTYPFYVDFNRKVSASNLSLFVQYERGVKDGLCRVERAHVFNLFVRLGKLGQFVAAVIAFLCLTVLVAAARAWAKGD